MAAGLPVGAFVASEELMDLLSDQPKLGHITTFGGNPVIASASLACLKELLSTNLIKETKEKEQLFRTLLSPHPLVQEIRGIGLMLAIMLDDPEFVNHVVLGAKEKGLILFWLLYEKKAIRISPPLTISNQEIEEGCAIILSLLDELLEKC